MGKWLKEETEFIGSSREKGQIWEALACIANTSELHRQFIAEWILDLPGSKGLEGMCVIPSLLALAANEEKLKKIVAEKLNNAVALPLPVLYAAHCFEWIDYETFSQTAQSTQSLFSLDCADALSIFWQQVGSRERHVKRVRSEKPRRL